MSSFLPAELSQIEAFHHSLLNSQNPAETQQIETALTTFPSLATLQNPASGISPLMIAADRGSLPLTTLLINMGAPWNALDRFGKCAGDYAVKNAHQNVVDYLVKIGTRCEMILGASFRLNKSSLPPSVIDSGESSNVSMQPCTKPEYLKRTVKYEGNTLFDDENDAVMMEWERPLMEAHASIITDTMDPSTTTITKTKTVLNVGFGMGIVDNYLQSKSNVAAHYICEAHPDVYRKMIADGWDKKPNVTILFGRWQDVLTNDMNVKFDGVFFDTYGEHHTDLEDFHSLLPKILNENSIYSFFNGICPDNLFFHGVACNVVKLQLEELGFECQFYPCDIQIDNEAWKNVRRKYWSFDVYYLPVCKYVNAIVEPSASKKNRF